MTLHPNESMVIVCKVTGKAVAEFFTEKNWSRVDSRKFNIIPISKYLADLNQRIIREAA